MTTAVASPSADASTLVEGLLMEGVSFNPSDPNELFELVDLLGEVRTVVQSCWTA